MASSPLFLYTGAEFGQRNDAILEFREKIEKKMGSIDYHLFYATDTSVGQVLSLLQNGSLFSEVRFIVLRNAEVIKKKEDVELIRSWEKACVEQKTQDAYLFLVSDDNSVDKKLENIVAKENKKIFWEMFEDRKEQWVNELFRKNGFRIEEDAVEIILEMIENNTEALRNECSRFFICFEKGYLVTSDDVENLLSHNREENAFTLFNSMTNIDASPESRLESALGILQKIRQSKESNGVQLIAGLTWCFRKLRTFHQLTARGIPSELDLKINGFSGKKMQSQYKAAKKIWTPQITDSILSLLAETDMQIRSGGTSFEEILLELLIHGIIIRRGVKLAQFSIVS